jgi:energy-coupling factor transporter ATP-binding protein EcfA2
MPRSKQEVYNQFSFNDVQNVLEVQLNKLRQQYQSFYPGNIYVLRAIDGDIDDALQNELQEEREKHIEERIILIPYYLSDSYCVGILIQFQTQNKILRAEYFDSVNDSDVVPKEIEKQFAAVYPSTVLQSREQCKNRNKSVSSELTVKNLLKAVENISLQYATDSNAHSSVQNVLNITETTTSTCEHNLMRLQNTTQHDSMSAITNSGKGNQYKLSDLQTELQRGLEKFSISNVKVISERVRKTEERIKQYEDEDSIEDAEREKVRLSELYRLQSLQDEIDRLTSYVDPENDKNLKIYQLEENLNKGLTTLKITSLEELLQRIQRFEGRVKDYEDEENVEDAEREKGRLKELYRLKGLVDEIRQLKSNPSPENNRELEIRQLEENLSKGLAKLKIMSSEELLQRIRRVESRVRDYEAEGNAEDAEREKVRLNELLRLKDLVDKIAQLNSNCSPENANDLEIRQLKENLSKELTKLRMPNVDRLIQRIHKIDNLIKEYEEEGSMEDAGKKRNELRELQKIKDISDRINELTDSANSILSNTTSELVVLKPSLESSEMCDNIIIDTSGKVVELNIDEMSKEIDVMPDFAGRTIISLLMHFQQKSSAENISAQTEAEDEVNSLVQKLKDQLKKEELYFENVKDIVRNLKLNITSNNYSSVEGLLKKLLNIIRPLNVSEIQKLVSKAQEAAVLIRDKDVVLLVGETGAGKSTTIQFLSGAKMEDAPVEISPGKYLDHITAVGPVTNPGLKNVKSAPFSKSETRYIAPVSIQLRDILGSHETGEIILCDAPGFEDTAGPEVDIANSIGVVEALKGTNSVKILALSSFKGLGDRAQGIQKLAHILISMIRGIENKLDSIYYAFTKYPSKTDVNALLLERKLKIDEDPSLQSDTAFTRVLIDMIEKTEETVEKIDPLHDNPKKLLKKIKKMRGIAFPQDVFCFSMSEKSRANIDRHLQRD